MLLCYWEIECSSTSLHSTKPSRISTLSLSRLRLLPRYPSLTSRFPSRLLRCALLFPCCSRITRTTAREDSSTSSGVFSVRRMRLRSPRSSDSKQRASSLSRPRFSRRRSLTPCRSCSRTSSLKTRREVYPSRRQGALISKSTSPRICSLSSFSS